VNIVWDTAGCVPCTVAVQQQQQQRESIALHLGTRRPTTSIVSLSLSHSLSVVYARLATSLCNQRPAEAWQAGSIREVCISVMGLVYHAQCLLAHASGTSVVIILFFHVAASNCKPGPTVACLAPALSTMHFRLNASCVGFVVNFRSQSLLSN